MGKDVENPNRSIVHMVLNNPINRIGFLPNLSEAAPHMSPVQAWQTEKMAETAPAARAISFSGTPKDSIISGRYGKTEVRAIGSAKRHIAREAVSKPDAALAETCGVGTENQQLLDR
jgi:hypothetical protein